MDLKNIVKPLEASVHIQNHTEFKKKNNQGLKCQDWLHIS